MSCVYTTTWTDVLLTYLEDKLLVAMMPNEKGLGILHVRVLYGIDGRCGWPPVFDLPNVAERLSSTAHRCISIYRIHWARTIHTNITDHHHHQLVDGGRQDNKFASEI